MSRLAELETFFNDYASRFSRAIHGEEVADEAAAAFADCFIGASPLGVQCGQNDADFRQIIPQGYAFYRSIGIRKMEISRQETTLLDEYHSMTRVFWHSVFIRKDGTEVVIDFEVIYFVQSLNGQHRIFAYITGDEQKALKENGLI